MLREEDPKRIKEVSWDRSNWRQQDLPIDSTQDDDDGGNDMYNVVNDLEHKVNKFFFKIVLLIYTFMIHVRFYL